MAGLSSGKDLLQIRGLSRDDVTAILDRAGSFQDRATRSDALAGRIVVNMFLEPSTRTRVSFEIAAKRMSADVVNMSSGSSSLTKGESLVDTTRVLDAMSPSFIVVRQIPVYSHCEHHLAPFFGHAAIGYLPTGRIVGLSKLTRLVNCFAARLQVQERLTQQIAHTLHERLEAKSVGVVLRCRHMCMESRGIAVPGEETVTSALLGDLEKNDAQRAEFFALVRPPVGQ